MAFSVTEALYDWMHKRRIVCAVAREMGINETTLSAELRSRRSQAKLGADQLIPLFQAIRRIGYGRELDGILHQFYAALRGEEGNTLPDSDLVPHVLKLTCSLGILSDCAARIPQTTDEDELARLSTMLRTEVLPVILNMDSLLSSRLKHLLERREQALAPLPAPTFHPQIEF
jgi:hypothetical protein